MVLVIAFPWLSGYTCVANDKKEADRLLSDILIPDAPEKYFLSSEQTEKLLYKSSAGRRDRESMTPEGPPVHRLPEVEEKE